MKMNNYLDYSSNNNSILYRLKKCKLIETINIKEIVMTRDSITHIRASRVYSATRTLRQTVIRLINRAVFRMCLIHLRVLLATTSLANPILMMEVYHLDTHICNITNHRIRRKNGRNNLNQCTDNR